MQQEKPTPKRKLKNIDFSDESSHIALVSKNQGGPASGANYSLVLKNAEGRSKEFIEKMQAVQVTLSVPDFLQRFFHIWDDDDRDALAAMLGYVEPPEDEAMEAQEDIDKWAMKRFESFSIIKSLHEAKNFPEALSKLSEDQYLSVLQDQVQIEKVLKALDKEPKGSDADTSTKVEPKVGASAPKRKTKEKVMTQEVEMVEKSALIAVEKAANETKVALEKALKQIADIEEAQKQAIVKSKTDTIQAIIKDEKQSQVILKAALALEKQEDFDALVDVFKSLSKLADNSGLFKEQGASVDSNSEQVQESALAKVIKSKYHTGK